METGAPRPALAAGSHIRMKMSRIWPGLDTAWSGMSTMVRPATEKLVLIRRYCHGFMTGGRVRGSLDP